MAETVLVITNSEDASVIPVIQQLEKMGQDFFRFNTETFPIESTINLSLKNSALVGSISLGNDAGSIELENIKSVWYRRPETPLIPDNLGGYATFIQDESGICLWSLYTTLHVPWVNPPLTSSRLLEHNKLYQMKIASEFGIKVPRTVITNDPDKLIAFSEECNGRIAVKLLKGNFFTRGESPVTLFVFTNIVETKDLLNHREDVRLSPIFAQEYVAKKLEIRATIVGKKLFACAIHSQDSEQTKIDWRNYDFEKVRHEPYKLPEKVENSIQSMVEYWGLNFGAVDLILTPDDEFVFLEINANGQWLWIEQLTDMPISRSIAELLANPPT